MEKWELLPQQSLDDSHHFHSEYGSLQSHISVFILLSSVHTHLCAKGLPGSPMWRQSWGEGKRNSIAMETRLPQFLYDLWSIVDLRTWRLYYCTDMHKREAVLLGYHMNAERTTGWDWYLKCFWTAADFVFIFNDRLLPWIAFIACLK